jgi:hypothetical protein
MRILKANRKKQRLIDLDLFFFFNFPLNIKISLFIRDYRWMGILGGGGLHNLVYFLY